MKTIYIALIISFSVLALIAILVVCFFLFRKKRFVRQAKNLAGKFNDYHTQLTSDCSVMIQRLRALGKSSAKYQNLYDERKKQYDDIIVNRDKTITNTLNAVNAFIGRKDFKKAKEYMSQAEVSIEEFKKSVSSFSDDLTNLLRDDSDTTEASLSIKQKYHEIQEKYKENRNELLPLEKSFNIIFENADKTFSEYSEYTDKAEFDKAKKLLPELDTLLSALLSIMDDLPKFESLANTIIPKKLEALSNTYTEMVDNGYDLDYLRIPETISGMNDGLVAIRNQLVYLDTKNVKEALDGMQSSIADILVKFDRETKAKSQFSASQDIIQTSTFNLEKEYSKHMNQLSTYQQTYVLDPKYIDQMALLRTDIEAISYLKRELDSYIGTKEKQPYSIICEKMDEMEKKTKKVQKTMADYSAYLESLKNNAQDVYNGLRDYYIILKRAQYEVRNSIAVTSINDSLSGKFKELYDEIGTIDKIILTEPVDVNKAKQAFAPFAEKCDNLVSLIKRKVEECQSAEAAIVYANAYRLEFTDSRPMLDIAESAFMEGDFDRAKEAAKNVINTFKSTAEASKV